MLHLADAEDEPASIGAILADEHAETFFPGLPAADLRRSNASLAALCARVAALRDGGATTFCLWACRPNPDDTTPHAVAYHIVATQCLIQLA